jgi:hypothetical protein
MRRRCKTCREIKSLGDYTLSAGSRLGRKLHCKSCCAAATADWRSRTPDHGDRANARRRERNKRPEVAQRIKFQKAESYLRHRPAKLAKQAVYREQHREETRAATRKWVKDNMPRKLAHNKARAKRVQQATPPWAKMEDIRLFYLNCPEGHEVDHAIPLKGKNVCGLHVESNLQYLLKLENRTKHARFEQ